jgi:DNA polymerase-3 subunit alpha
MLKNSFVHLHVHSHYSLLSALGNPRKIVEKAKESGMVAIGLTDVGNMHGAAEFFQECKTADIKAIFGIQAYLAPRSRLDQEAIDARSSEIVLLAKNKAGYKNLLTLSTEANLTGFFHHPRIDWEILKENAEGIICLTGGINGEIPQSIIKGDPLEKTEKLIMRYKELFGENLYFEVQRHSSEKHLKEIENSLISFGKQYNIPLVGTNNTYYVEQEDASAHDILLCIRNNAQKNDPGRFNMLGGNYSLRSQEEMLDLFSDLPEASENTIKIAEECNVELSFGEYFLPPFPVPEGETTESYFQKECEKGIETQYAFDPKNPKDEKEKAIMKRLYYEMDIINNMGFPAYFLIVSDFVQWSKDQGILVGPGRGSAAGSLVSFVLNITNIDPLQYNLLFERFLNPDRVSMPDIDIDFPDDRREEVLQYVRNKYGDDRVAQICTFGTMAARASVKDVGRVFGLGFTDMNSFAKLIPEKPGITLKKAYETASDLQKVLKENPQYQEIWNIAQKIEGTVRHVSVHACAVVISPDSITNHTALQHAPKDEKTIITQFSAKPLDKLGLLKMDFLGLKNLTILVRTLEIIEILNKKKIDIENVHLDDKKTFRMLAKGQTTGVFQLESAGMKRYLKELKPTEFEDIIAIAALYRPGPMEQIPEYISGKHGKRKITYLHPKLKNILEKTYGILVYQEQVMAIARDIAGFTAGAGYLMIKAVGKKIQSLLEEQKEKFIAGCIQNSLDEVSAKQLWDFIEPFANYGFNKSHSTGYAMIAYQTAFLKANYKTAFMTALLASDRDNTDRVIIDIEECQELDIEVLPPNVNESNANFTAVEEKKIRFGLGAVKGIGDSVVQGIIFARNEKGPFESFADFVGRCPAKIINKKSLEALAKSGALSEIAEPNEVLENIKMITDFAKSSEQSKENENQTSLFGEEMGADTYEIDLPRRKPATNIQRLLWEKETLGLFVSDHPLRKIKNVFEERGELIEKLKKQKKKKVQIGGIVVGYRKIITKSKKQMAVIHVEDPTGKVEVILFPQTYESQGETLRKAEEYGFNKIVLWVRGKIDRRQGHIQIIADELNWEPMDQITNIQKGALATKSQSGKAISPWKIYLREGLTISDLKQLNQLLRQYPGECSVEIHALGNIFRPDISVSKNEDLKKEVEKFL